jgi:hypothetical protein
MCCAIKLIHEARTDGLRDDQFRTLGGEST